jgi:signal transduction histidine kinase
MADFSPAPATAEAELHARLQQAEEQNNRLRRALCDLFALSAFPSVTREEHPHASLAHLADLLIHLLGLDIIYINSGDISGNPVGGPGHHSELAWTANGGFCPPEPLRVLFSRAGETERFVLPAGAADPGILEPLYGCATPIAGFDGKLITASRREDYPNGFDQLVLNFAVVQTATALQKATLLYADLAQRISKAQLLQAQEYSLQLQRLNEAFVALSSCGAVAEVIKGACRLTVEALRTPQCFAVAIAHDKLCAAVSDRSGPAEYIETQAGDPLLDRYLRTLFEGCTARTIRGASDGLPPLALRLLDDGGQREWLAAPLRSGRQKLFGMIRVCSRSAEPFNENDENVLVQIAQMVSTLVENAALYAQAQSSNVLKDEFLSNLSHELRTPLTAIIGWTSILKRKRLEETDLRHAIETMDRSAKQQLRLIEDILDVTRIGAGKIVLQFQEVNIKEAVELAVAGIRPTAQCKSITVLYQEAAPVVILADPARVQQVLGNLLVNAVKYTPHGGQITVSSEVDSGIVRIAIADSGIGIEPAFVPFLFDRFRQADGTLARSAGGLGLGLGICKALVELHGGSIRADSAGRGRGAVFTISFPLRNSSAAWVA